MANPTNPINKQILHLASSLALSLNPIIVLLVSVLSKVQEVIYIHDNAHMHIAITGANGR